MARNLGRSSPRLFAAGSNISYWLSPGCSRSASLAGRFGKGGNGASPARLPRTSAGARTAAAPIPLSVRRREWRIGLLMSESQGSWQRPCSSITNRGSRGRSGIWHAGRRNKARSEGGGSMALTLKPGTLVVASAYPDPPFDLIENGEPSGFDVELMRTICAVLKLALEPVRYTGADFNGIFDGLMDGSYDEIG